MASKLLLALLLTSASTAAGQTFLSRGFSVVGGHMSSYMSSKTVYTGSDGELHQKTHEVHRDVDRNVNGQRIEQTQEEWCKDGNCKGTVQMVATPSRMARVQMRLRDMFSALTETRYRQGEQQPHHPLVRMVFLAPRPQAQTKQVGEVRPAQADDVDLTVLGPFFAAMLMGPFVVAIVVNELRKRCFGSVEARELTGLAEPFAPAEEQVKLPKKTKKEKKEAAVAAASASASKLLGSVYANVEAKMQAQEKEATSAYLARVYERATA